MIIAVPERYNAPSSPSLRDLYYSPQTDKVLMWDGAAWVEIGAQARVRDSDRKGWALTRVRYAGQDFKTYMDEIQAFLTQYFPDDWKDWTYTNPGVSHIAYMAYFAQNLGWYINQRATDGYMASAVTDSSVALWSSYLGYKVKGASPASTDLRVTLPQTPNEYGFPVPIMTGHRFYGPDGLIYEAVSDVIFLGDTKTKVISVREGVTTGISRVSDGETNQVFRLPQLEAGQFVAHGSFVAVVDGGLWSEYEFLPAGSIEAFEVNYMADPVTVRFGDGLIGKVPRWGAPIDLSYVVCSGVGGRLSQGSIEKGDDVVLGLTTISLTVEQPDPAVGGTDPEAMVSVKANAPLFFATGKRAVTADDFLVQVLNYPCRYGAVSQCQVLVPRKLGDDPTAFRALRAMTASLVVLDAKVTALGTAQTAAASKAVEVASYNGELVAPLEGQRLYAEQISTRLGEVNVYLPSITAQKDAVVDRVVRVQEALNTIDINLASVKAMVDGATADNLEDTKVRVATLINQVRSMVTSATGVDGSLSATRTILAQMMLALSAIEVLRGRIYTSCFDATTGIQYNLSQIEAYRQSMVVIQAQVAAEVVALQEILDGFTTIQDDISGLQVALLAWVNTAVDPETGRYEGLLSEHISSLFALNSASNVVQVLCLTKDREGFYAAPSQALLDSVEQRLASLKLLEVSARAVDGSVALVPVAVQVWLTLKPNYEEASIRAEAETRLNDLLRGRSFGESLYKDDVVSLLKPPDQQIPAIAGIEGVVHCEVRFVAAGKVRAGNVIIESGEMITRGSVEVFTRAILLVN